MCKGLKCVMLGFPFVDKIVSLQLLQQQSTPLGQLHDQFYCELNQRISASGIELKYVLHCNLLQHRCFSLYKSKVHSDVTKEQPIDCNSLAPLVKQHCKKVS